MKELPSSLEVSDLTSFELNSNLPNVALEMADCSSETKETLA